MVRCLLLFSPQNSWLLWQIWSHSNVRNSRRGPPLSIAPSETPMSSMKRTSMRCVGEYDVRQKARFVHCHNWARLMLRRVMLLSSMARANSDNTSAAGTALDCAWYLMLNKDAYCKQIISCNNALLTARIPYIYIVHTITLTLSHETCFTSTPSTEYVHMQWQ